MARAAYITRKDGRYWFQKRFAAHVSRPGAGAYIRLALRTGDYHVADGRMAKVLGLVSAYEVQPDLLRRASALMADMRRFNMALSEPDGDALVERKTLEILVSRFIDEARWRNHPLTTDPGDFWHTWIVFTNANTRLDAVAGKARLHVPTVAEAAMRYDDVRPAPSASVSLATGGANDGDRRDGVGSVLSEVRRLYLDQRRTNDGDGRGEEDAGIVLDFLVDFLGDRPISSLTEKDFMKVENALPDIPHPAGIPARSRVSLHARWSYAQECGWDGLKRISRTRLKNGWHRSLHAFFAWARSKGLYDGPHYVFNLVNVDNAEERERDAWQPDEITKLFSLPLFTGCQSATWHWKAGDISSSPTSTGLTC